MINRRRFFGYSLIGLPLLAAACAAPEPARSFPPLRYDYLLPLRLNVASLSIRSAYRPVDGDLGPQSPVPPIAALEQMAHDRLQADGSSGVATFTIRQASIRRGAGRVLQGRMSVRLEIAMDTTPVAFAEAHVSRMLDTPEPERAALYDLTKQMMSDMNIEFEHQLRKSLQGWLLPPGAAPAPVRRDAL